MSNKNVSELKDYILDKIGDMSDKGMTWTEVIGTLEVCKLAIASAYFEKNEKNNA